MSAKIGSIYAEISADPKRFTKALEDAGIKVVGFQNRSNRSFKQAEAQVTGSFDRMGKSGQGFSSIMASAAIALKGGFLGALAGLGLAEIVTQVREVAHSVAEVGDQAKIAGIDVRSFQELAFVAEQNRIGVDALTDGLKEMNLRADEFILTGAGSSAEAFQRLGYNAATLEEKLKKPSELFAEIIGRLQKFDEAARIRIADEVFGGTGGEKFVTLIEKGERGIRDTIKTANDLGLVMDEAMIAKAAEVDRQFQIVANTVGTSLKGAIVSAASSLSDFINTFKTFEDQSSRLLQSQQIDIAKKRLDIENEILDLQAQQRGENSALSSVARDLGFAGTASSGLGAQIAERQKALDELTKQDAEIANILNTRVNAAPAASESFIPPAIPRTPPKPPGGAAQVTDYQRAVDSLKQSTTAILFENEALARLSTTVGDFGYAQARARAEAELLTAAQDGGRILSQAQREEVAKLADAYASATAASNKLADAQAEALDQVEARRNLIDGVLTDMRGALADGTLSWQELGDVALNVINKIVDRLQTDMVDALVGAKSSTATGGGLIAGLLGGFGKLLGFDSGGYTGDGGKHDPAGIVHRGEFVFNKEATAKAGPGNLAAMMRYLETGDLANLIPSGMPGFADGGYVSDLSLPSLETPSHAAAKLGQPILGTLQQASSEPTSLDINVSGAMGNAEIMQMVRSGVEQGLKAYNKALPYRIKEINANPNKV
jgi:lambda family phage tail tape measure protein